MYILRRQMSETTIGKYYYFAYHAWRLLWRNIFDDGLDDMKAFAVIVLSELFAILIVFDIYTLLTDRHTLLPMWPGVFIALTLSAVNFLILLSRDEASRHLLKKAEQESFHWPRAKRIVAYSIAYGVPIVLSAIGLWLTSVAGKHMRSP